MSNVTKVTISMELVWWLKKRWGS